MANSIKDKQNSAFRKTPTSSTLRDIGTDPIKYYLGDPLPHPDAGSENITNILELRGLKPRTLPIRKSVEYSAKGKDVTLTAQKLADFLTYSMQMAIFKKDIPGTIEAAQSHFLGGSSGEPHTNFINQFNPFQGDAAWQEFDKVVALPQLTTNLKALWNQQNGEPIEESAFTTMRSTSFKGMIRSTLQEKNLNTPDNLAFLDTFDPFGGDTAWNALAEKVQNQDLTDGLRAQWHARNKPLVDSKKFHSIKALFSRFGEEITKALSKADHEHNGAKISEEALNKIVISTITKFTTAHPNGKLHDDVEPIVRALLIGLFESDPNFLRSIGQWSGKPEDIKWDAYFATEDFGVVTRKDATNKDKITSSPASGYELLAGIWDNHKKPNKMTPKDERDRQRQWAEDMYNSCPDYMEKFHKEFKPVNVSDEPNFTDLSKRRQQEWGLNVGFVSLAELNQMKPPRMRSWVIGDADGKTATQPETIKQGMFECRQHTLKMHLDALKEIEEILGENSRWVGPLNPIAQQIDAAKKEIVALAELMKVEMTVSKRDRIGRALTAKALEEKIADIKTRFEAQNVVFDRLNDRGYPVSTYSKLDVLYKNVQRCSDFFPQVEIRQNANEHRTAMKYVGKLLQENELNDAGEAIAEDPKEFITRLKTDAEYKKRVQDVIAKRYAELTHKLNPDGLTDAELLATSKDGRPMLSILRDQNLAKDEMYARQILGFFMLQQQYPSALASYVIAETAQTSTEFKLKPENQAHPEMIFNDEIDNLGKKVVELGLRDYRQLIALELITDSTEKKVASKDITGTVKFIGLFEDPQTILNQIKVWLAWVHDKDILERITKEAQLVQIYDEEKGALRPMTVADLKMARSRHAADDAVTITDNDRKTYVYEGPEWMDAGSDASGRGTTIMNVLIGIIREIKNEMMMNHPVEIKLPDGTTQMAVVLPKNHAGVGAGNPRSQDKGNTLASEIVTQTHQGMLNLLSLVNPALTAVDQQMVIEQHRYGTYAEDPKHAEKVKWPDYKGNGIVTLTTDQKIDLAARCIAVMQSRVEMVYSEPYTGHLTYNTNNAVAIAANVSAREATRTKEFGEKKYPEETSYGGLRFIGAINRNYLSGECGPETQVLNYFEKNPKQDLQVKEGVTMLSDETRKNLIAYHKGADYATNMLSGFAVVCGYANFENAWEMAGLKRIQEEDGSYAVQTKSGKHSITDLCDLLKDYKTNVASGKYTVTSPSGETYKTMDELRDALEAAQKAASKDSSLIGEVKAVEALIEQHKALVQADLPQGIHLGHLALADHDRQFTGVARHVYELYFRMQNGNEHGDLDANKEKALIETLRTFTSDKIYDIMPPHMREACKTHKELIDHSRTPIAEDHLERLATKGKKGTLDLNGDGYYCANVHDTMSETGPTAVKESDLTVKIPASSERDRSDKGRG